MEITKTWIHYLIFSLIVVIAFFGNSLVIYVLFSRRKTFLNKLYGVFIFNLAIVDFLTSIFLIFSRFLYLPPTPTYSKTAAKIFCLMIWSGQNAFHMGYISIFTCVLLTVERWIAVVKPETYRSLKQKHAVIAVIFVWFWGIAINSTAYFRIKYDPDKNICRWTPLPLATKVIPWISLTVQSIIPYTTMVVLYIHIYFRIKNLPQISSNHDPQLKKVTVVALLACLALIIGWLPGRITFMLSKYGYVHPNSVLHTSFVMMTFCNSCVNPMLYGMCSSRFRAQYKIVFIKLSKLCSWSVTASSSFALPVSAEVLPSRGDSVGNTNTPSEICQQSAM